MSVTRACRLVCVPGVLAGVLAGILGCYEPPVPSTGWGMTDLPETSPGYTEVLDAAKAVVKERYPMCASSERAGFIVALTPVRMDGGSKTRKEISVLVRRNFTGAYDPVVRVRQFVEVGSPELQANPETGNAVWARPIEDNKWHALDYLPYEEQAIYDAILARVAAAPQAPPAGADVPAGGTAPAAGPPPAGGAVPAPGAASAESGTGAPVEAGAR